MAARVFSLDELASRIAIHLLTMSPKSTLALALTCQALKIPALRALWKTQHSLNSLIRSVVPIDMLCFSFPGRSGLLLLVNPLPLASRDISYSSTLKTPQGLTRPLTTQELNMLKRYASWMRRLVMKEWEFLEDITRLVLPPSNGTPPAIPFHLRELDWWLNETNFSFLPTFLSPYLTTIVITTATPVHPTPMVDIGPWDKLPDEVVPTMSSAIKLFPSSPQIVCLKLGVGPETRLTEEVSTFVLGCGEALQEFTTNVVLSTQAIVHLMKLPNLRTWTTEQGPPQVADLIHHGIADDVTSLFPSLWDLDLRSEVAFEWLSLFEAAKSRNPPWILAGGSMPSVTYHHPSIPIDSSLVSRFLPFTELVELRLRMKCDYYGPCKSHFTDEDVESLVTALPKLEAVTLGESPCDDDTCPTTIRSLLSFSTHCAKLRYLNIHFCTANLRADMLDLLGNAYSQGQHSKPKSALKSLVTQDIPIELYGYDPGLISIGMLVIFPSLTEFVSESPSWYQLEVLVGSLRRNSGLAGLTEGFMRLLNDVRELGENGLATTYSAVSSCFILVQLVRVNGSARLLTLSLVLIRRTQSRVSFAVRFRRTTRVGDPRTLGENIARFFQIFLKE